MNNLLDLNYLYYINHIACGQLTRVEISMKIISSIHVVEQK